MIKKENDYYNQYKPYVAKWERVPYTKIETMNLYKIHTYKSSSSEGIRKVAEKEILTIFTYGIYNKELFAIKLNPIRPLDFIQWTFKILNKESLSMLNESQTTYKPIFNEFNINGKDVYNKFIKPSIKIRPYTVKYNLRDLKYNQIGIFNTDEIKKIYEK